MNITAPIRRLARLSPERPAIVGLDDSVMSYADLDRAIDRMAGHAANLGLQAGDIAGLDLRYDDVPSLVLALALARIGVASAATSLAPEHLRLSFHHGQQAMAGRVRFDAAWLAEGGDAPLPMHDDAAMPCRVFPSSGTTGRPRHVPISHALMRKRVYSRFLSLGGGAETCMIGVGFGVTHGFTALLMTLWQGGTVVVFSPLLAAVAMRRHGVTVLVATPASLASLIGTVPAGSPPLPGLKMVVSSGSRLPEPLHRLLVQRLGAPVVSMFDATETGVIASAPMAMLAEHPDAAGLLWPDAVVQVVDLDGRVQPPGAEGALRIGGALIAAGYLGADGADATAFRDGWFYPGDIGTLDADGMLHAHGRAADLINLGGHKLHPAHIEQRLLSIPGVTDAAAFAVPDAIGMLHLWGAIVAPHPIADSVLQAFCDGLPPYLPLQTVLQVQALPRNENGKLVRQRLVDAAVAFEQRR